MSGKPDPQTVREVWQSLVREAEIEDRLRQIEVERMTLTVEMGSLRDERGSLRKQRWESMRYMDVTTSGNAGYEQRMDTFLMELVKPVKSP